MCNVLLRMRADPTAVNDAGSNVVNYAWHNAGLQAVLKGLNIQKGTPCDGNGRRRTDFFVLPLLTNRQAPTL